MLIQLLFSDFPANVGVYFCIVLVMILTIILHELGHGFAAIWQGDRTPIERGHMNLNPLVHLGPLSILVIAILGIGWGAMPVTPSRFRDKHGDAMVSFAGPLVNLVLAILIIAGIFVWVVMSYEASYLQIIAAESRAEAGIYVLYGLPMSGLATDVLRVALTAGILNIALFIFNLVPIPPLDGSWILSSFHRGYRNLADDPRYSQIWWIGFFVLFIAFGRIIYPFIVAFVSILFSLSLEAFNAIAQ